MTTPHAPEGWDVARAAEEVRAAGHSLYSQGVGDGHPMCRAYGRDYEEGKQDLRVAIDALITAARAEGARRERERIRAREANGAIGLAVSRYATRGTDADWSALLAAITEGDDAGRVGG